MGETTACVRVTSLTSGQSAEFSAVVDTGATYTCLPREALAKIGVLPGDEVSVELADGRTMSRWMGNVLLELDGRTRGNGVLLGEGGDASVIGVVTLESFGLTVDPLSNRLIPVPKIHHYALR